MRLYFDLFTTRELATIIWVVVFIIWALFLKSTRKAIFGLLKAFLQKQIVIAFSTMFLYVAFTVYLFSQMQLWDYSLLKDTIFWFFGIGFVLFMNLNKANENEHYFKRIVVDNLKLSLVLIFLVNFYTFSLLTELILIPVLFFIVAMNSYAGMKKGYETVKKITNFVLGFWGIFLLAFVLVSVFGDYQNLLIVDNLRAFLLPLFLTFAFLPFLYGFAVFMTYESLFVRLNVSVGERDKKLLGVTKRKMFSTFGVNLRELNRFSKENISKLWGLRNESELREIIERFKDEQIR